MTDPEPLPTDHPLWSAPNVLVTPHVGGTSSAMEPRAHAVVRAQLERYAAGGACTTSCPASTEPGWGRSARCRPGRP